ncbi:hypothetical protein [Kitasatospora sp. NPDC088779]|uniref:hypothetical protein n=1 Tax=Kitasatospora sp. NPDC088779 TaxID=3154964 RepID=UPI003435835C
MRRVVIFRLIPVDDPPKGLPIASPTSSEREIHKTEPGVRSSPFDGEPSPAQQTAAKLLLRYAAFARWSRQAEVTGYRIKTRASLTDLHVDLFDVTHNEVLVVLPSCARPGIWEALGRLHDQARFFTPLPRRVLLLPDEPDADLTELLLVQHVTAVWPSGPREFSRTSSML